VRPGGLTNQPHEVTGHSHTPALPPEHEQTAERSYESAGGWELSPQLRDALARRGLEAVTTIANGDCLYDAALITATGNRASEQDRRTLRRDTVDYLAAHEADYRPFHPGGPDRYQRDLTQLSRDREYAFAFGDLAPDALAHARGWRVTVIDEHGNPVGTADDQGRYGWGPLDGTPVTLLRFDVGDGHYLGTRPISHPDIIDTGAHHPDLFDGDLSDIDLPDDDMPDTGQTAQQHSRALRPSTDRLGPARDQTPARDWFSARRRDDGLVETLWPTDHGEVQILRSVERRTDVIPDPRMNNVLPWRDRHHPATHVYEPYAAEDGSVHPNVLDRVDHITATMSGSKALLRDMASSHNDTRLPRTHGGYRTRDYLTQVVWTELEDTVATEIRRMTRGEPLGSPPVRPGRVTADHIRPHERALIGSWGLFLTRSPADIPVDERPSLLNGRILGVYLGAVLDTPKAIAEWENAHPSFPSYAMDLEYHGGPAKTMSAEEVGNDTAFANTAVVPIGGQDGTTTSRMAYDEEAINAAFVPFTILMPDRYGGYRQEQVSVLVALENAFDPIVNPHGMIAVDYGPNYLWQFERNQNPVKKEPAE
jgi:hypothetical protein